MAPLISDIASSVAEVGSKLFSSIFACTASTTTIALSTTIPIASTKANKVIKLSVIPKNCIKKKVPIKDTGTAMAGISVDLQSPKNTNTTKLTSKKASIKVCITFSMDASKKLETS